MEAISNDSKHIWKGLFSKKFGFEQKRHITSEDQLNSYLTGNQ